MRGLRESNGCQNRAPSKQKSYRTPRRHPRFLTATLLSLALPACIVSEQESHGYPEASDASHEDDANHENHANDVNHASDLLAPRAPLAPRRFHAVLSPFGFSIDPYYWLRDDKQGGRAIQAYLDADKECKGRMMVPYKELEKTLYQEMVSRIEGNRESLPVKWGRSGAISLR